MIANIQGRKGCDMVSHGKNTNNETLKQKHPGHEKCHFYDSQQMQRQCTVYGRTYTNCEKLNHFKQVCSSIGRDVNQDRQKDKKRAVHEAHQSNDES